MKLRQIRAIMAVAHCGSMSAAAQFLGLSQPAVTRIVGMLEAELGAELFVRTHTGAHVTEAGLQLVRAGAAAFKHVCEIEGCAIEGIEGAGLCFVSSFTRQVSDHELAALIAIGRYGSPKRAAEALGVTQTAVGRSLATLAGRFDRPLIANRASPDMGGWLADASAKARRALNEIASTVRSAPRRRARPIRRRTGRRQSARPRTRRPSI